MKKNFNSYDIFLKSKDPDLLNFLSNNNKNIYELRDRNNNTNEKLTLKCFLFVVKKMRHEIYLKEIVKHLSNKIQENNLSINTLKDSMGITIKNHSRKIDFSFNGRISKIKEFVIERRRNE